ncbi:MAG: hypothetical protein ABEJ28_04000 [Salinigranum sp.]
MAPVTMPPVEEARSIFSRLGYTVSGCGPELLAERKWRTVRVTALSDDTDAADHRTLTDGGREDGRELRCFVTWDEYTGDLQTRLRRLNPSYEWAIIGVESEDDYQVVHQEEPIRA